MEYNFNKIEKKWQDEWEKKKIFEVSEDSKKKKCYILEMFPYPSGDGLHMGHALNYTIGDIYARFKRMNGLNVLYPMGYDSLGLPAENAAIKAGTHPRKYTQNSIKNFIKQQQQLGLSYDWSRMIDTSDSDYYKWDQWIFLKMLEKGIAYRKKSAVNWCSKCETVLANEQVHSGKCWRHEDTNVEIRHLEQWFFKITQYTEELLENVEKLKWPARIKTMQSNWIGKSLGTEINFEINQERWPIFTTRPDTLFGVTFMVISAQHPRLMELVTPQQKKEVEKFLKKLKSVSEKELDEMEKEGVFTGSYAINPITRDKVPVYAGNFVVADYGSGMVMAVPAHDQRDFEFANKYKIPIKIVIKPETQDLNPDKMTRAYTSEGILVNSGEFDGINNKEAIEKITKFLEKKKIGKKTVNYKLRDWLISRQRYWGTPIPIVYCDECGIVPVAEQDLPVKLPEKVTFGKGNPLTTNKEWVKVKCPRCGKEARRETDTMDTFVNSSWYYLRYCDSKNNNQIFDKKKTKYWTPIDYYIGGAEHACMHLIYVRFYAKFLRDLGLIDIGEPIDNLFNQGMLHASDGRKMSKSWGNVINPLDLTDKIGADSLRLALMSFASPENDTNWDEKVVEGSSRFIKKVYEYFQEVKIGKSDEKTESKLNKIIKEVTNQIENFKYNLAIIKIRELFQNLPQETSKEVLGKFLKLLSPFCPHITEELWHEIGNKTFISLESWPKADEKKIDDKFEKQEQAGEKIIADILNILKIIEARGEKKQKVYVYVLPNELDFYNEAEVSKRVEKDVKIFAVNDKKKYDPTNKSKNTKPGKPGIYLE